MRTDDVDRAAKVTVQVGKNLRQPDAQSELLLQMVVDARLGLETQRDANDRHVIPVVAAGNDCASHTQSREGP
jgi:hypothetical protein